jgi:hypothetical protein
MKDQGLARVDRRRRGARVDRRWRRVLRLVVAVVWHGGSSRICVVTHLSIDATRQSAA